jgi:hypothetical protein
LHIVLRHLRVLWRAERIIAETRLRILLRRSMLFAFAGLIAVFGLGMLNVAAYFALEPHLGAVRAALAAAGGDFVVVIAVILVVLTITPGPELTAATELRDASIDGLEAELAPLQERFAWLTRVARDPLDTVFPAMLVPLITAIMRSLRKSKPSG